MIEDEIALVVPQHQSCPSFSMIPVGAASIYGIPLFVSRQYRAGIFQEL